MVVQMEFFSVEYLEMMSDRKKVAKMVFVVVVWMEFLEEHELVDNLDLLLADELVAPKDVI